MPSWPSASGNGAVMSSGSDWLTRYNREVIEGTVGATTAPAKKSMTRIYKVWLWFRFVLMTFGLCCVFGTIALIIAFVNVLFEAGDVLLGIFILSTLASFAGGTLWYVLHRLDHKGRYM